MRIGSSVFLLAVGAILAFAVSDGLAGVDVHMVGWVLMAAGALGLVVSVAMATRPARTRVDERTLRTPDGDLRQRDIRSS